MEPADLPHEPVDVKALGVPPALLTDLVLRRALMDGHTSTVQLAASLCVSPIVMEEVLEDLRHNQLIEVQGRERRNYLIGVTDLGHEQAMERMVLSRYAGPVPVNLAEYTQMVHRQDTQAVISHESVRRSFSDLVIADDLLDALGPAIRSEGAIFLYGPPGTGKSAIAERMIRVHHDAVLIPHVVEVDGQIVSVFDPVVHLPVDPQPERIDRRWVLCRRPSVIVGGELTGSQLDLTFEPHAGIYLAPLQMQANNGILVIDDFGRQRLTPEQLLNRWIVPLDRSIDYLALDYGVKFEIPCTPKIVFSTNLEPSSLADEAFYRRIRSKVFIPPIEDDAFDEILRRVADATGVEVTPDAPEHLRRASRERGDGDLRPYLPGAVCELVRSITSYDATEAVLDPTMIDRIVELYFTQDPGMRTTAGRAVRPPLPATDHGADDVDKVIAAGWAPAGRSSDPIDHSQDVVSATVRELLDATHRLVWATDPSDAVAVTEQLAAALLESVQGEGAEVTTVSAVGDLTLVAPASTDPDASKQVEHLLRRFVEDAQRSAEVTADSPDSRTRSTIDPETGLASQSALNKVLGRLADHDTVTVIDLDTRSCTDEQARRLVRASFVESLGAVARGHDHLGRAGPDEFVVVLTAEEDPGVGAGAGALLHRLDARWSEERPMPVGFTAGFAAARLGPDTALTAARRAAERADPDSDTPWQEATAEDYR